MKPKKIVGFWWECDNCRERGYVEGDQIWRFCPYCANELTIQVDYEEEGSKRHEG